MALAWNRAKLATTIAKAPKIDAILTDGDTAILDLIVPEEDTDFTADTLLGRLTLVKSIEGNDLVIKLTARSWNGDDAYTSSTNPANSTATNVGNELEVLRVNLDSFWTTGGFAKTNS
ncbi:hypothetical protein [Pantanalinema sp. GBBB05]|uniref:hypothetical protein n=1 Tax=Pantanalinema sp. GBBB05 TaxID=2604139 RepID=UPI001DE205E9|nr:hypothetical protein [Pantanalinema sp. GBBB05]